MIMIFEMSTLKTIKGTYHGEQESSCSIELKESMSCVDRLGSKPLLLSLLLQTLYNNLHINSYSLFRNLSDSDELQQRSVNHNISHLHTEALKIQNHNCLIILRIGERFKNGLL